MLVAMLVDLWASLIDTQANSCELVRSAIFSDCDTNKLKKILPEMLCGEFFSGKHLQL
jgi:hypothetical protein